MLIEACAVGCVELHEPLKSRRKAWIHAGSYFGFRCSLTNKRSLFHLEQDESEAQALKSKRSEAFEYVPYLCRP